jgi:hypothetical protein
MKLLTVLLIALAPVFGESAELRDVPQFITESTENVEFTIEEMEKAGFPNEDARAWDPINKEWYEEAMVGKMYRSTSPFTSYHYWRYVTVYNVKERTERVAYLPYFEESCHDSSAFMAQWGERRNFEVSFSSSLGAEALGFSASVSMTIKEGVTFEATRRVMATAGLEARHYPYMAYEEWDGVTYIQTYNKKTKKMGYLAPSIMDGLTGAYPRPFFIDKQNMGFKVKREITKKCKGYNPKDDETEDLELYNIM